MAIFTKRYGGCSILAICICGSALAGDIHTDILRGNKSGVERALKSNPQALLLRDITGGTPLHTAARLSDPEMTRLLIRAGADVNARTYAGFTPLDGATHSQAEPSAAALKAAGAKPSVSPISGLSGKPRGKTDDPLNKAMMDTERLLAAGKGFEAFELLSPHYREAADDADVAALFGHAAYARGKFAHAVLAFSAVLEQHPDNHRIRLELARAYRRQGRHRRRTRLTMPCWPTTHLRMWPQGSDARKDLCRTSRIRSRGPDAWISADSMTTTSISVLLPILSASPRSHSSTPLRSIALKSPKMPNPMRRADSTSQGTF